jgi:hypothetical protein
VTVSPGVSSSRRCSRRRGRDDRAATRVSAAPLVPL